MAVASALLLIPDLLLSRSKRRFGLIGDKVRRSNRRAKPKQDRVECTNSGCYIDPTLPRR